MSYFVCDIYLEPLNVWSSTLDIPHFSFRYSVVIRKGTIQAFNNSGKYVINKVKIYNIRTDTTTIVDTGKLHGLIAKKLLLGVSVKKDDLLISVIDKLAYTLSTLLDYDHYSEYTLHTLHNDFCWESNFTFLPGCISPEGSTIQNFYILSNNNIYMDGVFDNIFIANYMIHVFRTVRTDRQDCLIHEYEIADEFRMYIECFDNYISSFRSNGMYYYKINDKKKYLAIKAKLKLSRG